MWSGDHTFPGVVDAINMLKSKGKWLFESRVAKKSFIGLKTGKQLVFVTNNSTKSRADYKKKFASIGLDVHEVR